MNTSRIIWVNGKPYFAGGSLRQDRKVMVGERGPEVMVPSGSFLAQHAAEVQKVWMNEKLVYSKDEVSMKRINVRDQWEPAKILGTLPWNEQETERRFSWQHSVNGCPTQEIIKLQVHRMIAGDYDEMAYSSGLHKIEVLRKLPEFCEKTDER